jgi:hypothetical protein
MHYLALSMLSLIAAVVLAFAFSPLSMVACACFVGFMCNYAAFKVTEAMKRNPAPEKQGPSSS